MPDDDDTTQSDGDAADEASGEESSNDEVSGDEAPAAGGRGWKIAAIVAVLAAGLSVGVLGSLLLAGGDDEAGPDADVRACIPQRDFTKDADADGEECPPKGARKVDGLVQKTTEGSFTIRTLEGGQLGETVKLYVREPDRAYIDIAHAQTHAALGQPVRVYLEKVDKRDAVVYMEDAPLLQ